MTDNSWRGGGSPLSYASLYGGEVYDARRKRPRGDRDVRRFRLATRAVVGRAGRDAGTQHHAADTRDETIRPVSVAEPKPGVFVFDLGQNFAGWCGTRAKGPAGTCLVLHHSELAAKDGMIDPWTNREAKATDTFVLRGEGEEQYQPRFTYHGFRYVEVTGYPGRPTLDDVTGCVVHADVKSTGTLVTLDQLINQTNIIVSGACAAT